MLLCDEGSCETLGSDPSQNPRRKNEWVHFVLTQWHVTVSELLGMLGQEICLSPDV